MGGSQGELCATQDEGSLANGYLCKQNCHSSGSIAAQLDTRDREEEMVVDQRSEVCVNPIYNLYAISVGVSTPIMLGLRGWARWQPPSPEVGILKIQLLKFWNFEIQWPTVTFVSHLSHICQLFIGKE